MARVNRGSGQGPVLYGIIRLMKLHFSHKGKQFFFATFSVSERRKLLSRIVEGQKYPKLTACGELVQAALLAVHQVWPSAGISDFSIMPDHVHVLLILDYDKGQRSSPFFMSHCVMDAVEAAVVQNGNAMQAASALYDQETPSREQRKALSIMMAKLLRAAIQSFFAHGEALHRPDPVQGKINRGSVLWNRSCYIELSFNSTQLHAIRRYIRLNPARAIWKAKNPDMFLRHRGIHARALDKTRQWDAMGELTLLASPFLFHVRLTMKKTAEEHREAIDEIIEKARHGMIPVSGFISQGEKEALRRLKAEPQARFIRMLPYGLPPKYDPSAEDSRELAAHRMLILSGFPESRKDDRSAFRRNCLEMNDLAAALCEKAQA